jgi:hypothetical protein
VAAQGLERLLEDLVDDADLATHVGGVLAICRADDWTFTDAWRQALQTAPRTGVTDEERQALMWSKPYLRAAYDRTPAPTPQRLPGDAPAVNGNGGPGQTSDQAAA